MNKYNKLIAILALVLSNHYRAIAQVIPDRSLGGDSSIVINLDETTDVIDGGATRGGNLFHSFQDFNVENGRTVIFSNPANVERIFTRVTGGSNSKILGTLGVDGTADLFLMNPNGIVIGPQAFLLMKGSFIATTASGIKFAENGIEFNAKGDDTPPLLTASIPVGLQFRETPGNILQQGSREGNLLTLDPGKTLALVGGDINIQGLIFIAGGRVELGSLGHDSYVTLQGVEDGWTLGYEGVRNFQDIKIDQVTSSIFVTNFSPENGEVSTKNLGNVQIQSRNFTIRDGAQILGSSGSTRIAATETIEISGFNPSFENIASSIANVTVADNKAGALTIETKKLIIENGGRLAVNTTVLDQSGTITSIATGKGGDMIVNASESLTIRGTGRGLTGLFGVSESSGQGGNIVINTPRLTVEGGGVISVSGIPTENLSPGAGNININAGQLTLNSGFITAKTGTGTGGEGANINITSSEPFRLENSSQISATAFANANGGNITIVSPLVVAFPTTGGDGNDIVARAETGRGGNIQLDASGIFGIEQRRATSGNDTNDIDASSDYGAPGVVRINNNLDPNQGVIQLPETVIDPGSLIAENACRRGSESQFTRSGRGGLPPLPGEDLSQSVTGVALIEPAPNRVGGQAAQRVADNNQTEKLEIIPARGWILSADGRVVLTAKAHDTGGRIQDNSATCQTSK